MSNLNDFEDRIRDRQVPSLNLKTAERRIVSQQNTDPNKTQFQGVVELLESVKRGERYYIDHENKQVILVLGVDKVKAYKF